VLADFSRLLLFPQILLHVFALAVNWSNTTENTCR
jgi:hypothetical protein